MERERQRRTLRELSTETKIREPYLAALEEGRYDVLPTVYMRSFVRTYATALHIPADELKTLIDEVFEHDDGIAAADRFPAHRRQSQPDRPKPQPQQRSTQPSLPQISPSAIRWLLVGALVLFAGVMGWYFFVRDTTPATTSHTDTTNVVEIDANDATTPAVSASGEEVEADSLILTATVSDTAWLNITMDGKRTQQVVVTPGMELRWSAQNKFVLSLGNAGALQFYRNGEQLKPFGKKGDVVRSVVITKTDIISSSTAWRSSTSTKPATKPATERPAITTAPPQRIQRPTRP